MKTGCLETADIECNLSLRGYEMHDYHGLWVPGYWLGHGVQTYIGLMLIPKLF